MRCPGGVSLKDSSAASQSCEHAHQFTTSSACLATASIRLCPRPRWTRGGDKESPRVSLECVLRIPQEAIQEDSRPAAAESARFHCGGRQVLWFFYCVLELYYSQDHPKCHSHGVGPKYVSKKTDDLILFQDFVSDQIRRDMRCGALHAQPQECPTPLNMSIRGASDHRLSALERRLF